MHSSTAILMENLHLEHETTLSHIVPGKEPLQTLFEVRRFDLSEITEQPNIDSKNRNLESVHERHCTQHRSISADAENQVS
jgi:hypothetical protein